LHQAFCLARILRIERYPAARRHWYLPAFEDERLIEQTVQMRIQHVTIFRPCMGYRLHDRKRAACKMRKQRGVLESALQPVGEQLQQEVTRVSPERIVDGAQVFDVDNSHAVMRVAHSSLTQQYV